MLPDKPIREHPDLPGDPYMGTNGGGGKRHRCKKPNNCSLIPNITKVTIFVPSFILCQPTPDQARSS
jgi:hypothetical protein